MGVPGRGGEGAVSRFFRKWNPAIAQCLSRWDTFDMSILQAGEDLFFVSFLPHLSRCGIDAIVMDAGATYAIDGKGRILDVR
ncbi:hypothetical protein MEBOL_005123 [Melittangium boletus DSM 14713]|uniref:Uncharacterized protein n=2 Tax=Melittangium boletus TaxID=83453 RepID=A0A250IKB6_9BACT|nr:hypothetical protein MEBOL_005123 [Melittangium boletus DSM 14713]